MRNGQLTPVSTSSGSRSLSPKTPDGRSIGGRGNDYFEPAIADYNSTPPQGRRQGGYGFDGQDNYESDPAYQPSSPKKESNLLRRMNTIAPGPFEMRGRRNASRNEFRPNREPDDYSRSGYGIDRPGTAASNQSGVSSSSGNSNGYAPPRAPRKNGYGGFGPPQRQEDFEPEPPSRAGTFPRPSNPVDAPLRTPSEPGPRPDRFRRPSNNMAGGRPNMRDTSRPPPPRTSLIRPTTPARNSKAVDIAAEFGIGNPYHAPTESMSSAVSAYSQDMPVNNSRASPPRGRKGPSDLSSFDDLMNDLQASMEQMSPRASRFDDSPNGSRRGRDAGAPSGRTRDASVEKWSMKTEMDRYKQSQQPDDYASGSLRVGRRRPTVTGGTSGGYGNFIRQDTSPPRAAGGFRDPSVQSSRGSCKSCGLAIQGKSVSSADGRLTGRYHKSCFVCTTCREPFSSAVFYVLDDRPYCELHYHKLNGSLCGSCGRGIEGQYLEDEALIKYHVGCFRCGDCGMSLSNGYFEVDGKSYCERDAWRRVEAAQQQDTRSELDYDALIPTPMTAVPPMGMPSPAISVAPPPLPKSPLGAFYAPSPTPAPAPIPAAAPPSRFGPGLPGRGMSIGLPTRPGTLVGGGGGGGGGGPLSNGAAYPGAPPATRPPLPPGVGLPRGQRLAPGQGPTPRPKINKRMTRLGMI